MEAQFSDLAGNPDLIVATPGRLLHMVDEVEGFTIRSVTMVCLDEATLLVGLGDQLRDILRLVRRCARRFFSATMPTALAEFVRVGLREPQVIRLDAEMKVSPDLKLSFTVVRVDEKIPALLYVLREVVPPKQQTVVFEAATRHHVELLVTVLESEGIACSSVYGTMDFAARKLNIGKFRARKTEVLVVTDVAARGIDIPLLDNVVSFDFPPRPKLFVAPRGPRRARRARRRRALHPRQGGDGLPGGPAPVPGQAARASLHHAAGIARGGAPPRRRRRRVRSERGGRAAADEPGPGGGPRARFV